MTKPDEELKLEMVEKEETEERVSELVLQLESDDPVELPQGSKKVEKLQFEEPLAVDQEVEEISLDLTDDDIQESLSLEISEDEIAELPETEEPSAEPLPPSPQMDDKVDEVQLSEEESSREEPQESPPEEAAKPSENKEFMEPVVLPDPGENENHIALAAKYEAEAKKKKKLMIIGGAALLGCLLFGGAGYFLYLDVANYNKAVALWGEANGLKAAKKYKSSQQKASQALETLATLKLLKKSEGQKLAAQVNGLLGSEDFRNKVAGKVVYEGKLIKKEAVDKLEDVKKTMGQAVAAVEEGGWQTALDLYQKAKEELKASGADTPEISAELNLAAAEAAINLNLMDGRNYLAVGEYESGLSSLQKALDVIGENPTAAVDKHEEVKVLIDRAKISKLKAEAESARRNAEFDKALTSFSQALALAENNEKVSADELAGISSSILEIKLFGLLTKGKAEVEAGSLEEALKSFDEALNFVLANPADAGLAKNEAAIRKKRIELAAAISSNQAELSKNSGDLSTAVLHQQNIVSMIEASPFAADAKLLSLKEAASKEIFALNNQVDIDQRLDYLSQNYKSIFQANHPLARSATLSNPRIVFVEQEGQKQLFNLKCTGYTSTGRLAFDLNYQYDADKKEWSVVSRRRAR